MRLLDVTLKHPRIVDFEDHLQRTIIGQAGGVASMSEAYQHYLTGMRDGRRPISVMLFLGPTGSGKTHIAESAAQHLFGTTVAMIKINCAEFQHSHEIAKIIGSPPGYLGHRETAPLITAERLKQYRTPANSFSIILLDEIEKANDSLFQLMLGVFDKAELTLGDTTRVDMSQTIIIATSNLGVAEFNRQKNSIGFRETTGENKALQFSKIANHAAQKRFTPEFMNRIDKIVVFNTLTKENVGTIFDREAEDLAHRVFTTSGATLHIGDAVKRQIVEAGFSEEYGARNLKREMDRVLGLPIANLILTKQIVYGDIVRVELSGDQVQFQQTENYMTANG